MSYAFILSKLFIWKCSLFIMIFFSYTLEFWSSLLSSCSLIDWLIDQQSSFQLGDVRNQAKVTTLVNHERHKQSSEPIKARTTYMQPMQSAGKRIQMSHDWF